MVDWSQFQSMSWVIMSFVDSNHSEYDVKCSSVILILSRMTLDTIFPPPVRFSPKNPRYFTSL